MIEKEIEKLDWDSEFFKRKVGIYSSAFKDDIFPYLAAQKDVGFDIIYFKIKHKLNNLKPFSYSGVINTYQISTSQKINEYSEDQGKIKEIKELKDLNILRNLALVSGEYSRFNIDPCFSKREFESLYFAWVDNSLNGIMSDKAFGYYLDKCLVGFISVKYEVNQLIISIIAVSSEFQGLGIGTELLNFVKTLAFNMQIVTLSVKTQVRNIDACRFYLKNGFTLSDVDFIYHYHRNIETL